MLLKRDKVDSLTILATVSTNFLDPTNFASNTCHTDFKILSFNLYYISKDLHTFCVDQPRGVEKGAKKCPTISHFTLDLFLYHKIYKFDITIVQAL